MGTSIDDLVACMKQISAESLLPTLEEPGNIENKQSTFVILVWVGTVEFGA